MAVSKTELASIRAPPGTTLAVADPDSPAQLTPDSDTEDEDITAGLTSGNDIALKDYTNGSRKFFDRDQEEGHYGYNQHEESRPRRPRPNRLDSVQDFELYTSDEEKAVLRKLDTRLVLFVALLYMLSFLDRSNIGNASIAGMKQSLRVNDDQYGWLLRGFYVTYILFEWMTLLYRVVPPHVYISVCVAAWGLVASLQALSTNFGSMLFFRLLLGITEAAFGPGVPFYLSFFFRRHELAYRTGLFISAAPLASSFASTLAYAIVRSTNGTWIQSWRLLFLVEGFPSVLVAVWAYYWIPDSPATARWLTRRERRIASIRMRLKTDVKRNEKPSQRPSTHGLQWRAILTTLADPKAYITALIFFSCNVAFSSMPVFEPIIVHSMGFSPTASQGLSALPHLSAFFIVLLVSLLSDRFQTRSVPLITVALLATIGYTTLAVANKFNLPHKLRYACLFPITAGFFSAVTMTIVWTMDNQPSAVGKGVGVAMLNYIGQLGPFVGTTLYWSKDAPYYMISHAICAGFMLLIAVLAFALRWLLSRANAKAARVAYMRVGREDDDDDDEDDLGGDEFVYML